MKAAASHVSITTNEYVRSHGKEPRGTGLWAFRIRMSGYWREDLFWHNGTYAAAKAAAVKHARNVGGIAVSAQP